MSFKANLIAFRQYQTQNSLKKLHFQKCIKCEIVSSVDLFSKLFCIDIDTSFISNVIKLYDIQLRVVARHFVND